MFTADQTICLCAQGAHTLDDPSVIADFALVAAGGLSAVTRSVPDILFGADILTRWDDRRTAFGASATNEVMPIRCGPTG